MTGELRIVQVVRSDAFAGVERYVCGVAHELAARGHDVRVVGGAGARMRQELGDTIPHTSAATSRGVVTALARIGRVEIVHSHMTAAELGALAATPFTRAPIVSTRHFPARRFSRAPAALGRFVGSRLATQISISRFVAANIGEPSTVIYNGMPSRPQAALEQPAVLMLQRLQREKAPADGLEIWGKSRLWERGWRLLIAGSGTLEAPLRALTESLEVQASVSFLGHVRATEELLSGASILLAPAPAEPFGLSVLEAMAHGVPVVAARGGAHVETLSGNGFLFAPGDTDEAAEILVRLADDPRLRRAEGGRLRERQQSTFSLEAHVSRLEELYERVVRNH